MGSDDLDMIGIQKALEVTRARLARAERERAELDRAMAVTREEERLLSRLLELRRTGSVSPDGASAEDGTQLDSSSSAIGETRHPAVQAVIDEMTATARPVHISELMRLLRERHVSIPGAGTQANLITHLRRDDRLIRTSRGMYGLAAWGLRAMPGSRRVARKKKRMRTSASEGRNQG